MRVDRALTSQYGISLRSLDGVATYAIKHKTGSFSAQTDADTHGAVESCFYSCVATSRSHVHR